MPPQVIVLAGLPGSGKSTFAAALIEQGSAAGQFARVCQDVLKTKKKCESAAADALASGISPVIDR
eukprot:COSAG05_NODE_7103_length_855_cov_1.582011_1_plen_65_part_10